MDAYVHCQNVTGAYMSFMVPIFMGTYYPDSTLYSTMWGLWANLWLCDHDQIKLIWLCEHLHPYLISTITTHMYMYMYMYVSVWACA